MSDDLVERVARVLAVSWFGHDSPEAVTEVTPDARAALAVALEEAAKVVEIGYFSGEHAAAAIRAMIPTRTF